MVACCKCKVTKPLGSARLKLMHIHVIVIKKAAPVFEAAFALCFLAGRLFANQFQHRASTGCANADKIHTLFKGA
jgi:hypothetical protein